MRVLLVEDDPKLGPILVRGLASERIDADLATTGRDGLRRGCAVEYALIILDVMLPDLDGFHVCRVLRDRGVEAPILLTTARDAVRDRKLGVDSGADDYLLKPFALDDLIARARAIGERRPAPAPVNVIAVGDLRMDQLRHQVWRGEVPVDLSETEYALLETLMRDPGVVVTRRELLHRVWGPGHEPRSNVVEVYVRYLRRKIDRPFHRRSLQTIRGVGYRICGPEGELPG